MGTGRKAEDMAREVRVPKHTLYAWKAKYGGIECCGGMGDERLKKLGVSDVPVLSRRSEGPLRTK